MVTAVGLVGAAGLIIGEGQRPASASAAPASITTCSGTGSTFAGGSGTTADPYRVASAVQLAGITGAYLACAFVQTADISLSGYPSWSPIGPASGSAFTGTYDGGSFSVSGLAISQSVSHGNGLFGYTNGALIANLTVSGVAIDQYTNATYRKNNNGALIGSATNSEVDNCHSSGSVKGNNGNGGLIGNVSGSTITRSSSSARVAGHAWSAGGLVGSISGSTTLSSSWATGEVTSTGVFTGGLVGAAWGTPTISESYATGDVSFVGSRAAGHDNGWAVGGLVGLVDANSTPVATVSRSFATGDVSGGSRGTGGLVGAAMKLAISDSFATGAVDGDATADGTKVLVGGLVGGTDRDTTGVISISNSYASGAVTTTPAGGGGGLYGAMYLSGSNAPVIDDSFWSPEAASAVVSSPYGTQATLSQMRSFALYQAAGWAIVDGWGATGTWGICSGSNTPFLLWMETSSPCGATPPPGDSAPAEGSQGPAGPNPSVGDSPTESAAPTVPSAARRPFMRSGAMRQLPYGFVATVLVREPGLISLRMTAARTVRAGRWQICLGTLQARKAGTFEIRCRYTDAAVRRLAGGRLRASVNLKFTTAAGRSTSQTSRVMLHRQGHEEPSPVTG